MSTRAQDVMDPAALGSFGIGSCHINGRSVQDAERWVPQMQAIGLKYYRALPTGWSQVEPEEGKWDWKDLDGQLQYLTERGFAVGGLLNGGVKWNALDKPGTLPVNNLPAWSNYVSAIVQRTKGRVKRWEVWNEPPNGTGRDQTPVDYAKLVVASYKAAKAADPTCLVGIAAKSVHVNYLEQAIKAGAKDHFDYITLHPYEVLNGVADNVGTESVFMHIVPTVRKMLAAQNPEKVNVPIIFTELGCDVKKGADVQAHALVKAYTMGIAQGVACIQWFEGMDGDSGPLGLLDRKGVARPSYTAMGQMIRHLGQHPDYLGWVLFQEKHYGFVFQGAEGIVLITWAHQGGAAEVSFKQRVRIVNPLTGGIASVDRLTLAAAPMLVLDVPDDLVAQAKTNRGKPLPWGGDYAQAESVSITMEGKQVEKGLHTLSGDAVAGAVVAYGGSARAGSVPGGNVFVVDPQFLSYDTVPIEITAVVRRNEANDNAGFKLVYESTNGLKTAKSGWYTVPDNKQWHTVRWQIDDAQFVNYWGYNFALESDGNQYNKYYIQSITVAKRGK
ncbi:beta-galactosidase [Roseimicrobium sp. ORNL1]|uniref:beta-galactosidase n=1 Tax=Roseimicrobium sp. ORNL1 TaxID=2711231 RepID=UPI00197D97AF|nr:beta-galactosidase [Roseimicrobium sp. ORNL1]